MKSLKFEFKRFYFSQRNLILLGLFIFILCLPVIFKQIAGDIQVKESIVETIQSDVNRNNLQYQTALEVSQKAPNDSDKAQAATVARKGLDEAQSRLYAFQSEDYAHYWKLYLENLSHRSSSSVSLTNTGSPGINQVLAYHSPSSQKAYYQYIVAHHLNFYASETSLTGSFESVSLLFQSSLSLLPIMLIIILSVSFFAEAFENQTVRLYQLIQQSKKVILFNYFLVPFLTFFSIFVSLFGLFYLIFGFLRGWGSPIYPYGQSLEYLTPIWQLDFAQLFFLIFGLAFIIALGQLLTLIFKKTMIVVGVEAILFVGYSLISDRPTFQVFKKFLPFPYLDSLSKTISDKHILFGNQTYLIGALYLLVLTVICWFVSTILFEHYIYRKGA